MRNKLYPLCLILLFALSFPSVQGQNWLYVQATRPPWQGGEGSIDSVEILIEPQGIYSRVEVSMSFSARGHEFENADSLEVIYGFTLPDYAFVCDSWLWVGDEPVQADILDSWSAFRVYESIVNRRLDPSLLTKYGNGPENNFYQLRIFPMAGDEARKVRLTFNIPTEWTDEWVSLNLPILDWFHSYKPVQSFVIQVKETRDFGVPTLWDLDQVFEPITQEDGEVYHELSLGSAIMEKKGELSIGFASPLEEGLYVKTYPENSTEGVYELVFLPEWAVSDTLSKNVLILVDLHGPTTRLTEKDLAGYLRALIRKHVAPQDSFNVIFSKFSAQGGTTMLSRDWIGGSEDLADILEPGKMEEYLGSISNLPTLLLEARSFMEGNSKPSGIVLVSSSDLYGSPEVANELVDRLEITEEWPPFHIVDFAAYPLEGYPGPTYYFQGNEYLYTQLVRLTGGEYYKVWDNSELSTKLDEAFFQTYAVLEAFDMHTSLADGFCFDRFSLESSRRSRSIQRPIRQLGRYFGSFPFELEVYGTLNDSLFFMDYELVPKISESNSLQKNWTANLIMDLEASSYNNRAISKIVDLSIENRILSTYTSFLALEPWMNLDSLLANGNDPDGNCIDCLVRGGDPFVDAPEGPVSVSLEEELGKKDLLTVYPNPFEEKVNVDIDLPENFRLGGDLVWTIMDGLGRTLSRERLIIQNSRVSLEWDGKDELGTDLPRGVYFMSISYQGKRWIKRVIKS